VSGVSLPNRRALMCREGPHRQAYIFLVGYLLDFIMAYWIMVIDTSSEQ